VILLLAGCASNPTVVHLTWIKSDEPPHVDRNGTDCVIVTHKEVSYADFGAMFRQCL